VLILNPPCHNHLVALDRVNVAPALAVAVQLEFESKIQAKVKAVDQILVSSAEL